MFKKYKLFSFLNNRLAWIVLFTIYLIYTTTLLTLIKDSFRGKNNSFGHDNLKQNKSVISKIVLKANKYIIQDISLENIRQTFLLEPSKLEYNLSRPGILDHSGGGQAMIVDYILNKKKNGFYVECGALDGERGSNTLFLERHRNWTGLLIEADPYNFNRLVPKRRKAYAINACLSKYNYTSKVLFNPNKNMGRIYEDTVLFKIWAMKNGLQVNPQKIQCFPLEQLMLAMNRTQIDYLSLDVEGSELDILYAVPFKRLDITVMSVEFCHVAQGKRNLQQFVEKQGYKLVMELTKGANDLIFVKTSRISKFGIKLPNNY